MLIIYAHPNHQGHCGYILKHLVEKLKEKNADFQVLDLYKEGFEPVLKAEEHYTSGHRKISKDTAKLQKMIKNEDRFAIIYPTWWNSTPAILKGFFDRVLTSHFAFQYDAPIPKGLLNGKVAVFSTTGGPAIFEKTLGGNRSLKVVTKDTLRFCGLQAKGLMIDRANKFTEKQKHKIEKKVSKGLNYLDLG